MISYEDFDLRIQADGDEFVVSARRGSQSASAKFDVDLSLGWNLLQLENHGSAEVRKQGAALFDALIRGLVRDLYQQARGSIGGDSRKGLRIRIMIDPRDERLRAFLNLPWEILYDQSADAGHSLGPDPRRPIVRTIDSMEQTVLPSPGALRKVLVVMSNPSNSVVLDLDREREQIEDTLDRMQIHPEVLRHATRSRFRESIRESEPQIVHYMGHGAFDRAIGEGVLVLEGEHGDDDLVDASTFASFFAGKPMPRLVVLASCLSAHGSDPMFGPFASVAAALVAAGLPAVIAMQTYVRDQSAIHFTAYLYRWLARGNPVEAAVAEARNALLSDNPHTLDWAVPVLFVRSQTAEIEPRPNPSPESPPAQPAYQMGHKVSHLLPKRPGSVSIAVCGEQASGKSVFLTCIFKSITAALPDDLELDFDRETVGTANYFQDIEDQLIMRGTTWGTIPRRTFPLRIFIRPYTPLQGNVSTELTIDLLDYAGSHFRAMADLKQHLENGEDDSNVLREVNAALGAADAFVILINSREADPLNLTPTRDPFSASVEYVQAHCRRNRKPVALLFSQMEQAPHLTEDVFQKLPRVQDFKKKFTEDLQTFVQRGVPFGIARRITCYETIPDDLWPIRQLGGTGIWRPEPIQVFFELLRATIAKIDNAS